MSLWQIHSPEKVPPRAAPGCHRRDATRCTPGGSDCLSNRSWEGVRDVCVCVCVCVCDCVCEALDALGVDRPDFQRGGCRITALRTLTANGTRAQ